MKLADYNKETMAKATGRSLPISPKVAIEISSHLRGKDLQKSKTFLEGVIKMKNVVPYTRFNKGVGHKPGIGPGRYPIKAASEVLSLLNSAEANAQFKTLNTSNLTIGYINASKASASWHYGRQRRRKMKRTNMNIILIEKKIEKEQKTKKVEKPKEGSNKND